MDLPSENNILHTPDEDSVHMDGEESEGVESKHQISRNISKEVTFS